MTTQRDAVLVYTVSDVRRALGCGRPTAYRLVKSLGKRIGKRFVVSKVVFETWLANDDASASKPRRAKRPRKVA